jgi:hypothetical protein
MNNLALIQLLQSFIKLHDHSCSRATIKSSNTLGVPIECWEKQIDENCRNLQRLQAQFFSKNEYISIEFSVSATSKSGTKWHMAQHSNFLFQFVAGILEQILLILSLASSIPYPQLYVQKILSPSTISRLK